MILVTGATGYLGLNLIEELIRQGREVLATASTDTHCRYFEARGVRFQRVDIRHYEDFSALPQQGVEAVAHLAALIPERATAFTTGEDYLQINALGTYNVLRYCRDYSIRKLIYTTSHYEASNVRELPIDENVIDFVYTGDHAEYIIAKIAGDQYVTHFAREYGMQGIILRTTCIRGHSRYDTLHQSTVARKSHWLTFIEKAVRGEPIEVWGDCTTHLRDHLYLKDAVRCLIAALDSNTAAGRYNMASGTGITFDDEVKAIVRVFCRPERVSPIVYRPDLPNHIDRSWVYDISRTKRDLQWTPVYTYEAALADIREEMIRDGLISTGASVGAVCNA